MQSELPLWSSGLEKLGYSDPFPSKTNSTSPEDKMDDKMMEDVNDSPPKPPSTNESDEEKGWILYIGAICNRRTVNDILIDMWRGGEDEWLTNVGGVVQRTADAVQVVDFWYAIPTQSTSNSIHEDHVSTSAKLPDWTHPLTTPPIPGPSGSK
jgi:hypothetical protein